MSKSAYLAMGFVAAAVVGGMASTSLASAIAVTNFSFESPALSDGNYTASGPTGWTSVGSNTTDAVGVQNWQNEQYPNTTATTSDGPLASPGDGFQSIYVNTKIDSVTETNGLISDAAGQTVSVATSYTLTVAVGQRLDYPFSGVSHLALIVNGNAVATTDVLASQLTPSVFKDFSATFTTGASDPLVGDNIQIQLSETATAGSNQQVNFDNVRLDATAVPEPACLGAIGLVACAGLRRCRAKA